MERSQQGTVSTTSLGGEGVQLETTDWQITLKLKCISGADPGFPVGGAPTLEGGEQYMVLPNFPKNCMKLRTFWAVGGERAEDAPLDPTLQTEAELFRIHFGDSNVELPYP